MNISTIASILLSIFALVIIWRCMTATSNTDKFIFDETGKASVQGTATNIKIATNKMIDFVSGLFSVKSSEYYRGGFATSCPICGKGCGCTCPAEGLLMRPESLNDNALMDVMQGYKGI